MSKLEPVNFFKTDMLYGFQFLCPGCDNYHMPVVNSKDGGPVWDFNGSLDYPTFSPSLLVRWEEHQGEGQPTKKHVCHSFIREGNIQFLGDCTHALAGQTVELPEVISD